MPYVVCPEPNCLFNETTKPGEPFPKCPWHDLTCYPPWYDPQTKKVKREALPRELEEADPA